MSEIAKLDSNLSLQLSREDLKSIFGMCMAKPDSQIKTFNKRVFITKQDLVDLNNKITAKLQNHGAQCLTNVAIKFRKNKFKEFSSMEDFSAHAWDQNDNTVNLILKWDFLVQLPQYKLPQRHTLTLKITSDFSIKDIFNVMLSQDDNEDDLDIGAANILCRVDFIDGIISDELVNIVCGWHETLEEDDYFFTKLYKYRFYLNTITKTSIHLLLCLVYILFVVHFYSDIRTEFLLTSDVLAFCLITFGFFWNGRAAGVAMFITNKIDGLINKASNINVIKLTKGDENLFAKKVKERKKVLLKSLFALIPAFIDVYTLYSIFNTVLK